MIKKKEMKKNEKKIKRNDVTRCDWFSPNVFGPNLMWNVVIGSVLMCLDQTWCEVLWLVLSWCDPLGWCDLIIVKNLKDSINLKVPKRSSKLQEGCRLRKKIHSSKETFKTNSSERLALKKKIKNFESLRRISKERFQVSKIQERFQKWKEIFKDWRI